jgi:pimeloyl-[acyl-carrier protein] methyl ester esterase
MAMAGRRRSFGRWLRGLQPLDGLRRMQKWQSSALSRKTIKLPHMTKMTIILLPGMDGTGELFEPFMDALRGEFNLSLVKYPVNEALGYAELEAIVRTFLPLQQPYVILGESFSGPIAVSIAASAGKNLKALILCCTFAKNPRPALSLMRGLVDFLPVAFAPVTVLSHLLLGRFSTAVLRLKLVQSLNKVSPNALRARLKEVLAVNVSQKIASIQVPVLYLRATHDRLVPPSTSILMAKLLPKMQLVELAAPHFLLQTVPIEAAKVVSDFIRENEIFYSDGHSSKPEQKLPVTALKGMISKPVKPVSIDEMNAAIANRGATADN